jgi:hypothetical protein
MTLADYDAVAASWQAKTSDGIAATSTGTHSPHPAM